MVVLFTSFSLLCQNPNVDVVYEAISGDEKIDQEKLKDVVQGIRKRLKKLGIKDAAVDVSGERQILVHIPNIDHVTWARHKLAVGRWGKLELLEVANTETQEVYRSSGYQTVRPGEKVFAKPQKPGDPPERLVVLEMPIITDKNIENATALESPFSRSWDVRFTLDRAGDEIWFQTTSRLSEVPDHGGRIAIVLEDRIISTPVVMSAIRKECVIAGVGNENEAKDLAFVLSAGSLSYPIKLLGETFRK